jgi:hypothetical protein
MDRREAAFPGRKREICAGKLELSALNGDRSTVVGDPAESGCGSESGIEGLAA